MGWLTGTTIIDCNCKRMKYWLVTKYNSLKIPTGKSETVNRRAYNGERKKEGKKTKKIMQTIQRNLKIEQREPHKNRGELRKSGMLNVK